MQDWQPYAVDPYSCYMCDHTSIAQIKTFLRRYKSDQWTTVVAVVAQDEREWRKTEEQMAGCFVVK